MAKNWREHVRGDKIKWVVIFTAVLAVIVGVLAVFSDGFKNWDVKTWKVESGVMTARAAEGDSMAITILATDGEEITTADLTLNIGTKDSDGYYAYDVICDIPIHVVTETKYCTLQYSTLGTGAYVIRDETIENDRLKKLSFKNRSTITDISSFVNSFGLAFSYTYQELYPLPETPTKEGYIFTGWYYDEACTQPYDGSPILQETTFYAGWIINRYTVTFDSNGGAAVESVTVDWNTAPASLPTPEREGHTFIGWFDGDTLYNNDPIKSNKTLTAHWQINTYTVTFMVDGEPYKTVTVEWGTVFQTVMNVNDLTYYNVFANGAKMSKGTAVKSDMTVEIEEMSGQEKTAEFFAKNWWVLIIAGAALVIGTAIVVSVVMRKRR